MYRSAITCTIEITFAFGPRAAKNQNHPKSVRVRLLEFKMLNATMPSNAAPQIHARVSPRPNANDTEVQMRWAKLAKARR